MTTEAIEHLRLQTARWGHSLSPSQVSLLIEYATILASYELANVVGTTRREAIILEHLVDSLSCFAVEDLRRKNSLVDVGTGAGLPGIPLAIARSELDVTLLEATQKKTRFLMHVARELGLNNLEVLPARAEKIGRCSTYRETFDLATARALAALPVVLEYCAPFVRTGGVILAMKGRLPEEELMKGVTASQQLGVALREVRLVNYPAPLPQKERRLVVFDKVDAIPTQFPRRVGLAKKRPLGN